MASKYSKMCRTCLTEDAVMCSIFEVNSTCDNATYGQIIVTTTGVQVTDYDELPTLICTDCKRSATHAYQFKQQSKKADVTLRSLISKRNNVLLDCGADAIIKSENITDVKYEFGDDIDDDFNCNDFDNSDVFCELGTEAKKEAKKEVDADHVCTICSSSFESVEVLRTHALICVQDDCEDVKGSFCPLCGLEFEDSQLLLKHVLATHHKGPPVKKKGRPRKALPKTPKKPISKNLKPSDGSSVNAPNFSELVPLEVTVDADKKLPKPSCDICHIKFDTQKELHTHFNSHNGGDVLCCSLCGKMYLELAHFNNHLATHHPEEQTKNPYIEKMTQQVEELKAVNEERPADHAEETVGDHQKLSSFNDLMKTGSSTAGQIIELICVQVCGECGQLFTSSAERTRHNDAEHPELSNRCNYCSKMFSSAKTAARHRKTCKQIESKHVCYTCGLKYKYELTLNKHILKEHKGQSVSVNFMKQKCKKNFACKVCNKNFYRQELLDKHLKTHSPNIRKYECDICKKKFNRKDNLRSHMQIHDPKRTKLASNCLCLYCGRSFSNSSNLIVHMRRHTGEKPYKCDFCGKGFPRSSDLQCHRRSHTGEKPYLCNICGKGFRRNNKLSRHMRVHTGQRPYKCIYCEKAFSQSNDLTLHVRRHTGDKPYVCEICGDRFIQGTALHNHRRTHNHYPPSTSGAPAAPFGLLQPKPIRTTLTAINVKKITDIAKT